MFIDGKVPDVLDGRGYVECRFESLPLLPRTYELHGGVLTDSGVGSIVPWQRLGVFRITGEVAAAGKGAVSQMMETAPVVLDYSWEHRGRRRRCGDAGPVAVAAAATGWSRS